MLPPRFLGQALCLEAGTSQGPEEVPRARRRRHADRVPEGVPGQKRGKPLRDPGDCANCPPLGGAVPVPFEVCPLGASGPGNLTSQFRFWSLLLIHVESLPSLGQREDVEM